MPCLIGKIKTIPYNYFNAWGGVYDKGQGGLPTDTGYWVYQEKSINMSIYINSTPSTESIIMSIVLL